MTGTEYSQLLANHPESAHRTLFDEYYAYVYTVVYSMSGTAAREDIEECASDVFADVFRELDHGRKYDGELKGFIATVAKRRAIDRYRRQNAAKRRTEPFEALDNVTSDSDPQRETETAELARIVMEKIEALGEPDSSLILGRYYFGRSSRELAEEFSMKTSAVRMRCKRALKRLREELTEYM